MTFEKIIVNNVFRNLRIYIGYLLSSIFSVTTFYILSMICYHPSYVQNDYKEFFLFFREIIYAITIFFIIYFLKMFIKSKSEEFGIFLILGMDKKQLKKTLFVENIVIGILALIIGIIFGTVFLKFFLIIVSSILEINELKFYFSVKVLLITTFRYLILFCIIPVIIGESIKVKNVIDLINYKKKENTKIKISVLKSIMSIIVVVIGYYLVATLDANDALLSKFFIILILFILGNYLFFCYAINYIIHLGTKIKKVYLDRVNFLFISSLKYRMYDNRIMLFIVTILLAVVFTSIGAVYIQKSVLKMDSIRTSPISLNYFIDNYHKYDKDEEFIDRTLKKNNIKYNKVKLNIIQITDDKITKDKKYRFNLIKQSEYNNIASLINRRPVILGEKETMLVPNYEHIDESEKKFIGGRIKFSKDNEFIIKGNVEGCITFKGILLNTYIVPDKFFNRIYEKYDKKIFIGYEVKQWEKFKNITEKINEEAEFLNENRDIQNMFFSRMYIYSIENMNNNIMLYFTFLIGVILYLAAVSFMSYKFYVEIKQDKNKYSNMIRLGVTLSQIKKIITREMIIIFFVPYIIATIDALCAYKILYLIYRISILKSILQVITIFFIINFIYFLIWRFKNIIFLYKDYK